MSARGGKKPSKAKGKTTNKNKAEKEEPVIVDPPKEHVPWSKLVWPEARIAKHLAKVATTHMIVNKEGDFQSTINASCTLFGWNDDKNIASEFTVPLQGFDSISMIHMRICRKILIPFNHFVMAHKSKILKGGELISAFLSDEQKIVEFVLVQICDVEKYLAPFLNAKQQIKKQREEARKLPANKTPKEYAIEKFGHQLSEITNFEAVTADQWKSYFSQRITLEERAEASTEREFGDDDDEDGASNAEVFSKDVALEFVCVKTNEERDVTEEEKKKHKAITEGLYMFKQSFNRDQDLNVVHARLHTRFYSPYTIGNFIDFQVETMNDDDQGTSGSAYYIMGSLESDQTTEAIESIDDEQPSRIKKLIDVTWDQEREFEHRTLIHTKPLLKLQEHVFGDKIKLSPHRFFHFLATICGFYYLSDVCNGLDGIFREADRSYLNNADSEAESEEEEDGEEDAESNVSNGDGVPDLTHEHDDDEYDEDDDDDDHHGHSHSHGHSHQGGHSHSHGHHFGHDDDDEDDDDDEGVVDPQQMMEFLQMMANMQGGSGRGAPSGRGRGGSASGRGRGGPGPDNCPTQ